MGIFLYHSGTGGSGDSNEPPGQKVQRQCGQRQQQQRNKLHSQLATYQHLPSLPTDQTNAAVPNSEVCHQYRGSVHAGSSPLRLSRYCACEPGLVTSVLSTITLSCQAPHRNCSYHHPLSATSHSRGSEGPFVTALRTRAANRGTVIRDTSTKLVRQPSPYHFLASGGHDTRSNNITVLVPTLNMGLARHTNQNLSFSSTPSTGSHLTLSLHGPYRHSVTSLTRGDGCNVSSGVMDAAPFLPSTAIFLPKSFDQWQALISCLRRLFLKGLYAEVELRCARLLELLTENEHDTTNITTSDLNLTQTLHGPANRHKLHKQHKAHPLHKAALLLFRALSSETQARTHHAHWHAQTNPSARLSRLAAAKADFEDALSLVQHRSGDDLKRDLSPFAAGGAGADGAARSLGRVERSLFQDGLGGSDGGEEGEERWPASVSQTGRGSVQNEDEEKGESESGSEQTIVRRYFGAEMAGVRGKTLAEELRMVDAADVATEARDSSTSSGRGSTQGGRSEKLVTRQRQSLQEDTGDCLLEIHLTPGESTSSTPSRRCKSIISAHSPENFPAADDNRSEYQDEHPDHHRQETPTCDKEAIPESNAKLQPNQDNQDDYGHSVKPKIIHKNPNDIQSPQTHPSASPLQLPPRLSPQNIHSHATPPAQTHSTHTTPYHAIASSSPPPPQPPPTTSAARHPTHDRAFNEQLAGFTARLRWHIDAVSACMEATAATAASTANIVSAVSTVSAAGTAETEVSTVATKSKQSDREGCYPSFQRQVAGRPVEERRESAAAPATPAASVAVATRVTGWGTAADYASRLDAIRAEGRAWRARRAALVSRARGDGDSGSGTHPPVKVQMEPFRLRPRFDPRRIRDLCDAAVAEL